MSNKKAGETTEAMMRAKGYITAAHAAELVGKTLGTVYNWIAAEKIEGLTVARARYVRLSSLVQHIGPEGAKALGLAE